MPSSFKTTVLLEGFLNKRNTKKSRFALQSTLWNKRWFELCGDTLTYAKNPKDLATGEIQVFAVHECEQLKMPDNVSFELLFPERSLLLQASSAEEADKWVSALQESYKVSSGGKALRCPSRMSARSGITRRSDASSDDGDEGASSPAGGKLFGKGRSGAGGLSLREVQDVTVEPRKDPERPPSPRSLLANPSAFGKFARDGNLFSGPQTPTRNSNGNVPSGMPPDTTSIETFEPVPPTPPEGALRNAYSGNGRNSKKQSRKQEEKQKHLGVRGVVEDEHGLATIQLATPPADVASLQLGEDENWLDDDWDEDGDSPAPPQRALRKHPSRDKKHGFGAEMPFKKETRDDDDVLCISEAVQEFVMSPPATPKQKRKPSAKSRAAPQPPPPAANPIGVRADDDWLEEDWDSDEA